jgi:hypothetical protein
MISLNKMLTATKLAWNILELEERTQELWSQDKCAVGSLAGYGLI